jgi:4-(gamma-glutamylamino)butanal dehydrogenase
VTPDSPFLQEQVFGPVLAISTFTDEADAVRLSNSTVDGLAASVFTSDIGRAHRVSRDLGAGTVSVNTIDAFSAQTPFASRRPGRLPRSRRILALVLRIREFSTPAINPKGAH